MAVSSLFTGPDRIEVWERVGRPIRQGSLKELLVSDQDRIYDALTKKDALLALSYLKLSGQMYLEMCVTLLEWSLAFPKSLEHETDATQAEALRREVFKTWVAYKQIDGVLIDILSPDSGMCTSERTRVFSQMNEVPRRYFDEAIRLLESAQFETARKTIDQFVSEARTRHDSLCLYLWVFPTVIAKECGQRISETVLLSSFKTCSFYEPIFKLALSLPPEELAVILAEHMRAHFSGQDRKGSVEVVEDSDRFELIFDACGSGGAMRRRAEEMVTLGLGNYPDASPATWGLQGKVPSYCAHCAQNEVVSIERIGYPAWVVGFNPDASKPCRWVIYKDPADIPERHFERLGFEKDVTKYRRRDSDASFGR